MSRSIDHSPLLRIAVAGLALAWCTAGSCTYRSGRDHCHKHSGSNVLHCDHFHSTVAGPDAVLADYRATRTVDALGREVREFRGIEGIGGEDHAIVSLAADVLESNRSLLDPARRPFFLAAVRDVPEGAVVVFSTERLDPHTLESTESVRMSFDPAGYLRRIEVR